jgi:hypothetical protein
MTVDSLISIREVDSRLTAGLQVRLLWSQVDGRLWVAVLDTRSGETFRVEVRENECPLDVFNHPYAYAADQRIDVCLPGSRLTRPPAPTDPVSHSVPSRGGR